MHIAFPSPRVYCDPGGLFLVVVSPGFVVVVVVAVKF